MIDFVAPTIDWAAVSPVLVVLAAGVLGVLLEALVPARARRSVQLVLTLGALAGALVAVALLWGRVQEAALSVVGGSYLLTPFGLGVQAVVVVCALLGVLVVADRPGGQDAFAPTAAAVPGSTYEEQARRAGLEQTEVYPLVLFATGGMMLFPATDDLVMLFIALEVLSLPLYVLCATARRRRLLSQEAAAKYFLLGSFASALLIFGVALLYGFAGSVRLGAIAEALAGQGASPLAGMDVLALAGVLLVVAGLLFKVGAAPFHAWTPDVYTGAPTPVTGFMAACTKAAAVGALVRFLFTLAEGMDAGTRHGVEVVLWTVALLTMVVGTVVGVVQTDIKRVLAYSSIAHAGFVLVALVGFSETGAAAVLFYLLAYGLATVGAFAVVTVVRERLTTPVPDAEHGAASAASDTLLGEATHLAQWAGVGRKAPWLTAAFALFLLSMAGIPLTAGFIAKFGAFSAAVDAGAWPLAVAGVVASAVAVFFYVRVIVLMVLTPPADELVPDGGAPDGGAPEAAGTDAGPDAGAAAHAVGGGAPTGTLTAAPAATRTVVTVVTTPGPAALVVALCAAGVLLLGLLPASVLDLAGQAAKFVP
ncbi:NADH-quinone oxidoreductase subunit NuoN [Xylanimonas oleitrophica]|uniref:NADH-quinone oxidoreductase subunit N n=1 Tax=Xylanimonas oleitrophica TaxID=2607479 RepID=A0A2W5YCI9_9MICO|nr:NADH-quinone oxidoreductase subunit NuoN [Xylanimonas oleitrophica]PZR51851.1 NADH-quinone oxidoreductase subunit NuoN [Xylanimonas oleitrophica]